MMTARDRLRWHAAGPAAKVGFFALGLLSYALKGLALFVAGASVLTLVVLAGMMAWGG